MTTPVRRDRQERKRGGRGGRGGGKRGTRRNRWQTAAGQDETVVLLEVRRSRRGECI